jgi:uncharacterized membrane protein
MSNLKILVFLISFTLIPVADASVIHGKVFSWETLEPINGVIVEINTTPVQKKVTENGSYIFDSVPPGNYTIRAVYKTEKEYLYAEENITIVTEGRYVIDLILFPEINIPDIQDIEMVEFDIGDVGGWNYFILIPIPVIIAFAVLLIYLRRSRVDEIEFQEEPDLEANGIESLPDDLREVVEILIRNDGRISQRDLRKKIGCSEAKMSLMVADLERRGIVEKVKKGRGNIIFLKDEFLKS